MRSRKMDRSKRGEEAFAAELAALIGGIKRRRNTTTEPYAEKCNELLAAALKYMDELNKVRKHACPLSTNILLSSISESLLLSLVLQKTDARRTRAWNQAENDSRRKGQRISSDVPVI